MVGMALFGLENLGLAWSPLHLAVAAIVVIAVFSPQLMPKIGRMLGRLLNAEVRRRLGVLGGLLPRPATRRTEAPVPEALPPVTRRVTVQTAEAAVPARPEPKRGSRSAWKVAVIAAGIVAVLSWFLLHSR
jgi:hypothetical protein